MERRNRFERFIFGDPRAKTLLIQMIGEHDRETIGQEYALIKERTAADFCLAAFMTEDWNAQLSPWKAPAVFGNEAFGDGAAETLARLLEEEIPGLAGKTSDKKILLGGYSLAGLFALWAVYQCEAFAGAAAVSPSVWFPGFTDYVKSHPIRTDRVYLSLGDKEEKTRNPVMAQVGCAIRKVYAHLQKTDTRCVLEWNPGNHFKEPDVRMAKAFAWLLGQA